MIQLSMARRIWDDAVGSGSIRFTVIKVLLLIAASLGAIAGIIVWKNVPHGVLRGAGNPLSVHAVIYWSMFMSGAASQNKPANACLVPGLTRNVRQTAVLAWLVTMAPFVAISLVHPRGWMVLLTASVTVTAFGLYRAGCEKFIAVATVGFLAYLWLPGHPLLDDTVLASGFAASLLFAAWALKHAFPQGGERHFGMLDKQERARALDTMQGTAQLSRNGGGKRPVLRMYLRRALASRDGESLLMYALGPNNHPILLPVLLIGLGVVAVTGLTYLAGFVPEQEKLSRIFCISMLTGVGFAWYRFASNVLAAGGEQALVRMAPGMPRAPQLNHVLGKRILLTCAVEWLALAGLVVGALVLWNTTRDGLMIVAGFLFAVLPLASLSLADYSGKSSFHFTGVVVATIVCLVTALVSIFWVAELHVWLALMALILSVSGMCIWVRWHSMITAPPAFPANRMA